MSYFGPSNARFGMGWGGPAAAAAQVETLLVLTSGTLFGNYTTDGGNAAVTDLNENQANNAGGTVPTTNTVGFIGYTFDSAKTIAGFRAVGSNDRGFFQDGAANDPNIRMRASNGAAPTDVSGAQVNGTQIGSGATGTDANGLVLQEREISNGTAYTSVWIWNVGTSAAVNSHMAEARFYEWL